METQFFANIDILQQDIENAIVFSGAMVAAPRCALVRSPEDEELGFNTVFCKNASAMQSFITNLPDAMATMHDFVVTMMLYVLYICYAVASVFVVVAALQIYKAAGKGFPKRCVCNHSDVCDEIP